MIMFPNVGRVALALVGPMVALAFQSPFALGQEPETTSPIAQRDQLYDELARDVAELEKRLGIVKRVVELVGPTVVHIESKKNHDYQLRYGSRADIEEAGSGIIVELKGKPYVLTNRHVIKHAEPSGITIRLSNGRPIHPTRTWEDPETDVAIMAVDISDATPARVGDSNQLEIGDFVLAVGSPFGLTQSVTYGIVSAKGRHDLDLGDGEVNYQNFIQTDAAINPGNSGGPLINLRGEVVGINTAIASSSGGNEGIGFSIPINNVINIARQLTETGKVDRAFLGVSLDRNYIVVVNSSGSARQPRGARVTSVTPDSPAEKAGILVDDVVVSFDGISITDDGHLVNVVGLTPVNRQVEVLLSRDGRRVRKKVRVRNKTDFQSNRR